MAREVLPARCIATLESHTGRIEIIPPIFVVSFTLFSPLNINGHMLSGVMAQEVTTAYNTRLLTLFYCLQISSIVFSYTSILSRFPLCPLLLPSPNPVPPPFHLFLRFPLSPSASGRSSFALFYFAFAIFFFLFVDDLLLLLLLFLLRCPLAGATLAMVFSICFL